MDFRSRQGLAWGIMTYGENVFTCELGPTRVFRCKFSIVASTNVGTSFEYRHLTLKNVRHPIFFQSKIYWHCFCDIFNGATDDGDAQFYSMAFLLLRFRACDPDAGFRNVCMRSAAFLRFSGGSHVSAQLPSHSTRNSMLPCPSSRLLFMLLTPHSFPIPLSCIRSTFSIRVRHGSTLTCMLQLSAWTWGIKYTTSMEIQ